jgi:nucleoside-diphosphate-sugar epimerase
MKKKVLITGISGFLGSHIASSFIESGWNVIGLKRKSSNLWRCENYLNDILWVEIENENWDKEIINLCPDVIIHSAWDGVGANERLNYKNQLRNLNLVLDILNICKETNARFIGLGSQAEYGTFNGNIDEDFQANPNTAYGVIKLLACNLVKGYSEENNIDWFWFRLFPIFGEMEASNWLIPSVIGNILSGKEINLTPGQQKYAYLYVKDFAKFVLKTANIESAHGIKGIYNISGGDPITLQILLEKIREKIKVESKLNFGALEYRPYQTMHMQGNMMKFKTNISEIEYSDFDESLHNTVRYYLTK